MAPASTSCRPATAAAAAEREPSHFTSCSPLAILANQSSSYSSFSNSLPFQERTQQQHSSQAPRFTGQQHSGRRWDQRTAQQLPSHTLTGQLSLHSVLSRHMTITSHVRNQLVDTSGTNDSQLIRILPSTAKEHEKFLDALEYPKGPWKLVAERVSTRDARQVISHAQKYRQKIERHNRGAAKQKAAQRKEQEQRKDARGTVPATIEEQPKTAAVVINASNSSVGAPVTSRFDLPPLEEVPAFREYSVLPVPTTQAYVPAASFESSYHANVTVFNIAHGSLSQTHRHFHRLTEATPDMNDPEDLMGWLQYFLSLAPSHATTSAAATSGRGMEHATRHVQDKRSEIDELRLNRYALSPQSVRDVPAQLNTSAPVPVFGNRPDGCVVHHL